MCFTCVIAICTIIGCNHMSYSGIFKDLKDMQRAMIYDLCSVYAILNHSVTGCFIVNMTYIRHM